MIAARESREWWRPAPGPERPAALQAAPAGETSPYSVWAFRGLVFFTLIMVAAPQNYITVLGPLRLAFVSAAAAVGAYLLERWSGAGPALAKAGYETRLVLALLAWATLTLPFSRWPGFSFNFLLDLSKTVIIFWLVSSVVRREPQFRAVFWTLSVLALILASVGVKDYVMGTNLVSGRITGYQSGVVSDPNELALILDAVIPMTAVLGLTSRRLPLKFAAFAIVAISLAGIVVSMSRGGALGLAAVIVATLVTAVQRKRWSVIVLTAVVMVGGIALIPDTYSARLASVSSMDDEVDNGSARERWRDMSIAAQHVVDHPVVGAGIGLDFDAIQSMGGSAHHVHTAYLQYGVDLGVPGMALFVALFICALSTVSKAEKAWRRQGADRLAILATGARISLIGYGVAATFLPVGYSMSFYYVVGLAVALRRYQLTSSVSPQVQQA